MGLDYSDLPPAAAALHAAGAKVQAHTRLIAAKTGHDAAAGAQNDAPVDTGFLENTIGVDVHGDGLGWTVYATAEYAAHQEYGTTGPYPIPGAFGRDGSVMHPGVAPQPYMGPNFERQVDQAEDALEQAAVQALR